MPTPEELNAALHAAEHIEWGEPWRRHAQVLAAVYRKQERMLRDQRDSHLDEMAERVDEARRDERERVAQFVESMDLGFVADELHATTTIAESIRNMPKEASDE